MKKKKNNEWAFELTKALIINKTFVKYLKILRGCFLELGFVGWEKC
jgi:hypothetical protein